MGIDGDAQAACDPRGRLHGVEGVVIADASVMPTIPMSNTHVPTLMIGERFGEWARNDELFQTVGAPAGLRAPARPRGEHPRETPVTLTGRRRPRGRTSSPSFRSRSAPLLFPPQQFDGRRPPSARRRRRRSHCSQSSSSERAPTAVAERARCCRFRLRASPLLSPPQRVHPRRRHARAGRVGVRGDLRDRGERELHGGQRIGGRRVADLTAAVETPAVKRLVSTERADVRVPHGDVGHLVEQ